MRAGEDEKRNRADAKNCEVRAVLMLLVVHAVARWKRRRKTRRAREVREGRRRN